MIFFDGSTSIFLSINLFKEILIVNKIILLWNTLWISNDFLKFGYLKILQKLNWIPTLSTTFTQFAIIFSFKLYTFRTNSAWEFPWRCMTFHRDAARNCVVLGKILELFAAFSADLATPGGQVMPAGDELACGGCQNDEHFIYDELGCVLSFY